MDEGTEIDEEKALGKKLNSGERTNEGWPAVGSRRGRKAKREEPRMKLNSSGRPSQKQAEIIERMPGQSRTRKKISIVEMQKEIAHGNYLREGRQKEPNRYLCRRGVTNGAVK